MVLDNNGLYAASDNGVFGVVRDVTGRRCPRNVGVPATTQTKLPPLALSFLLSLSLFLFLFLSLSLSLSLSLFLSFALSLQY